MSVERARELIRAADGLRKRPFNPPIPGYPAASLREYEQRDREVYQLHVRAAVEAAAALEDLVEALT